MSNNKNCKIIQDLLPNYIDKLTNEETNTFIEEHLKTCNPCKQIYENMKKDIGISNKVTSEKEIQYIKKYNNRLRLLRTIILLFLLIFVLITFAKFIILSNLQSKSEEYVSEVIEGDETYVTYTSENFHGTTYQYSENNYSKLDIYKLGDKTLLTIVTLQDNVYTETKIYRDGDTVNMYKKSEERSNCLS